MTEARARRARIAAAIAAALPLVAVAVPARAAQLGTWDRAQEQSVARAGILPNLPGGFHGEQALSSAQLSAALQALSQQAPPQSTGENATAAPTPPTAAHVPSGRITVATFDRILVEQLGMSDVAAAVQAEARRAGLQPPSRFGTEVVARELGLRFNHPAPDDRLELYPTDPITRAEAAWSFAQVLDSGSGALDYARATLARFKLPVYSGPQRTALRLAVSKIGMPYVWGGESDTTSSAYGYQAHGGYDCSGLVWRVFKLSGNPAGRAIGGRTAAQMAGEIPRSQRIAFDAIQPADLLFFGTASFGGKATESSIVHTGIALSGDWMIHSSDQGVYVSPLFEDWRRQEFAWARRLF